MKLIIEFKKYKTGKYGGGYKNNKIEIDSRSTGLEAVGFLYHEFTHFVLSKIHFPKDMSFEDEANIIDKEDKIASKIQKHATRKFKYMLGIRG